MSGFLNKIPLKNHAYAIDSEKFNLNRDVEKGPEDNRDHDGVPSSEGGSSPDELVIDADLELEEEHVEGAEEDDDEQLEPISAVDDSSLHHRGSFSGLSLFSTASMDLRHRPRSGPPAWWIKLKAFLYPPDLQNESGSSSIPNYRYTPIFSAVIIPFSILLEIPGLTGNWYIRTINNQTVEKRPNPILLDVALGISMGCALVANVALIVRFLEKNVKLMTILCVTFLTLHDLINIIAVTTFGVENRFDDGFTYGESFWMTLCSTIASTFTNASLITDFIRTPDFASSGSGLTRKQRSLVIMVIILLVYIAFGALIEGILLELNFIDALYFTICSIEAIGFGDVPPTTTSSKVFVCFYAIFGIINLALAVSLTRETVLEALEVGYRKRVHAARVKRKNLHWRKRVARRWREAVEWRLREKEHPIWVMDTSDTSGVSGFVRHWALLFVDRTFPQWTWRSKWKGLGAVAHPKGMHLNLEALEGSALESAAMEAGVPLSELLPPGFAKRWAEKHPSRGGEDSRSTSFSSTASASARMSRQISDSNLSSRLDAWMSRLQNVQKNLSHNTDDIPLTHARLGRMVAMLGGFALAINRPGALQGSDNRSSSKPIKADTANGGLLLKASSSIKEEKTISQQYDAYRHAMEREEVKAFYARLTVVWTLFLVFWLVGSGVFMVTEGWSFGIALYFCVIAFTTIGFGDYSPKTPAGRSIFVGWALLGVATMTILISVVAEAYTSRYKNVLQSTKIFDRAVTRYKAREKAKALTKSQNQSKVLPPTVPLTLSPRPSLSAQIPKFPQKEANSDSLPCSQSHPKSDTHIHTAKGGGFANLPHTIRQVDRKLEQLPRRILAHAHLFSEHLQYFVGPGSVGHNGGPSNGQEVPSSLRKLMDDIAGASKFGERIQTEILQDADARQTLFTLSIEKALRKMIEAAEDAIESLEERNRLLALNEDYNDHDEQDEQDETRPSRSPEIRFTTNQKE